MQALEKKPVDEKHVDGSNGMHDSTDGVVLHETMLDCPVPPSSFHDGSSMLEPPAAPGDTNHYETIPGENTSLPHTDFNQELPSEYTIPSSQETSVNSPSQYQKLMVRSETPAYTLLQVVPKSDVSTTHGAVSVDEASCNENGVEGDETTNGYATLLASTKENENEYASLTICL